MLFLPVGVVFATALIILGLILWLGGGS